MTKRKRHTAEFEAKVALEAIREALTTAELARKHDIHPTMIGGWTKAAIETMASAFDGKMPAAPPISETEGEKLHARIGQLVVERDFLAGACSLILGTGGKERSSRIILTGAYAATVCCSACRARRFAISRAAQAPRPCVSWKSSTSRSWKRRGMGHGEWPVTCSEKAMNVRDVTRDAYLWHDGCGD